MKRIKIRQPDTQLTVACQVTDLMKAEAIKNLLATHRVPCELAGEHQAGFTGALPIDILVRDADLALAGEIIRDHNLL